MEKRKDSLSIVKMCRFCLVQNDTLESLYDSNRSANNGVNLHLKILTCVSIEIFPSDKMPTFICERCKFFMNLFYEYKQIVRQSDETILQYIQHNSPMEIITWPSSLANVFRKGNESVNIIGTVEGGATLQVSSQDNFDSDEEDGNVYNIKIGDGPHDESKTAHVKVITSKDGKEMKQIIEDPSIKGTEVGEVLEKTGECWACDKCDCTYPLQQLLELHKIQKHRERTVECELCNAKFFSKYDLSAHLARHSDEMPFRCAACAKKFKRLIMLKRHEKMVHSDLPQQVCSNCPASFLTTEELKEHKKKHIRVHRPYICNICDKKFHEKNTLQRHIVMIHNKEAIHCCEYCPERFSTVSKLTRHVRSHAGLRPYPCKFCDKSFTKSHHYTRHLRQKHRDASRGGAVAESEQYRCEQCADSFATQDELIYHSAIHATQNLTCPLCQEKFPDVDAVTAHIKSHVNGVEFMCDYCELVFTTKEKLENHQITVHEEEINADEMCDESSMENEDDDDNSINVKEEDDHMVIEIKKPNEFMINNDKEQQDQEEEVEDKPDVTNSEESGSEATYMDLGKITAPVVDLPMAKKNPVQILENKPLVIKPSSVQKLSKSESKHKNKPSSILRKVEEMKRKVIQQSSDSAVTEKKKVVEEKPAAKVEGTNSGGASDKSLRLLEKELQDLKRTNSRSEVAKNPIKTSEVNRSKRQPMHTSTPKSKVVEEKKLPPMKSPAVEKKSDKRITKENKEPKEVKEAKSGNGNNKEEMEKKEEKEKETTSKQSVIKNGSTNNDKSNSDDGTVRRSTRPSKIQNYAKMIRDRSQAKDEDDDDDDESSSEDDEEYIENEKSIESRTKTRRASIAKASPTVKAATPTAATPATPAAAPRKRGRPRKVPLAEVPAKIKKQENNEVEEEKPDETSQEKPEDTSQETDTKEEKMETDADDETEATNNTGSQEQKDPSNPHVKSPIGQNLKKVPIKALPPGIKPMPLPLTSRSMTGEVCEMQIGKKVVKVQKIVMTKAEVEAMAKKGLVEMKDGTMVLKQGIKLPNVETATKTHSETEKESPVKKEKAAPTRCDLGDDP